MKLRRDEYLYVRTPKDHLVRVSAIYQTVTAANAHLHDHPHHMIAAVFESMVVLCAARDSGIQPPSELLIKRKGAKRKPGKKKGSS
jgi:hypothetical protein